MSGTCKSLQRIKSCADGPRTEAYSGRRPRERLGHGGCYKILTANSGNNFSFSSTAKGCGEILNWNNRNKRSASLVL